MRDEESEDGAVKTVLGILLAITLAPIASATPEYWEVFQKSYGVKAGSAFAKAECSTCHTAVPKHNAYGTAVHNALQAAKTDTLTQAILLGVERKDSDKDGWTNGDEIRAGTLPGNPKTKPAGSPQMGSMDHGDMPAGATNAAAPAPGEGMEHSHTGGESEMIPKHSFHPVLVHFPIALFIFGAFLEVLGARFKKPAVREAGYWNLLAGTVSTVAAIPSGFAVALRMGYQIVPGTPVFFHLSVAIGASLTMLGTVLWRRKGTHLGFAYFSLLLLAAAAVGAAGHFGGGLVYGS